MISREAIVLQMHMRERHRVRTDLYLAKYRWYRRLRGGAWFSYQNMGTMQIWWLASGDLTLYDWEVPVAREYWRGSIDMNKLTGPDR